MLLLPYVNTITHPKVPPPNSNEIFERGRAYLSAARVRDNEPKGMLLLGVQGCGKSLAAKATSSLWNLPLEDPAVILAGKGEEVYRWALIIVNVIIMLSLRGVERRGGGFVDSHSSMASHDI